jgi:hypothetical protein
MQVMTQFEKRIFQDVQGLPPALQEKIAHLVHLVRREFIPSNTMYKSETEAFLSICGKWKDARTVEEQLNELYASRCSTERTEHAF